MPYGYSPSQLASVMQRMRPANAPMQPGMTQRPMTQQQMMPQGPMTQQQSRLMAQSPMTQTASRQQMMDAYNAAMQPGMPQRPVAAPAMPMVNRNIMPVRG